MSGYLFFFFLQCIASDPFFTGNNFVIIFRRYAVVLFIINLALGHLAGTTLNALANHQRPFLLDGSGRVVSRNDGVLAVAIQIVKAERLVDASLACAGMTTMCTHYYYVSVQNTLRRCDATESRTKPQQQKTNQTRCCLGYMPRQNIQKRQNNNNQTKKKERTEFGGGMDETHFALHDGRFAILTADTVQELVEIVFQLGPTGALDFVTAHEGINSKAVFLEHFTIPVAVGELFRWQGDQIDTSRADKVGQGTITGGSVGVGFGGQRGLEQYAIGITVRAVNRPVRDLVSTLTGGLVGWSVRHGLATFRLVGGGTAAPISL
jgi:hypothetical protein